MPFTWISVFRSWWAMLENISTDKELGPYWTTAVWNDTHLCVINIRNLQKTRISKILHLLNTNLLLEPCTHHLLIKHEHICYCIYCQQVLVGSPLQKRTEYHLNDTVLKPELQSETLAASHVFHNKKKLHVQELFFVKVFIYKALPLSVWWDPPLWPGPVVSTSSLHPPLFQSEVENTSTKQHFPCWFLQPKFLWKTAEMLHTQEFFYIKAQTTVL